MIISTPQIQEFCFIRQPGQLCTWMRDSGRPVVWDRLSRRLMPGYGSVSKVTRSSSTCSLEKLVLFLRLALREEPPLEATDTASSEGREKEQVPHQTGAIIVTLFLFLCNFCIDSLLCCEPGALWLLNRLLKL